METAKLEKLYNLAEVEKILSVSRRTLLKYIKEGRLDAIKIGNCWKVKETDLRRFLNADKQKTADRNTGC